MKTGIIVKTLLLLLLVIEPCKADTIADLIANVSAITQSLPEMIAFWPFTRGFGARDFSTDNPIDGTVYGANFKTESGPSNLPGRSIFTAQFQEGSFIEFNNSELDFGDVAWTISFWAYMDPGNTPLMAYITADDENGAYLWQFDFEGTIVAGFVDSGGVGQSRTVDNCDRSGWQFLALSYNPSQNKLLAFCDDTYVSAMGTNPSKPRTSRVLTFGYCAQTPLEISTTGGGENATYLAGTADPSSFESVFPSYASESSSPSYTSESSSSSYTSESSSPSYTSESSSSSYTSESSSPSYTSESSSSSYASESPSTSYTAGLSSTNGVTDPNDPTLRQQNTYVRFACGSAFRASLTVDELVTVKSLCPFIQSFNCSDNCLPGSCRVDQTMPAYYRCDSCNPGWTGDACDIPACSPTCVNGGNCTATNICACPTQYAGAACEIPICGDSCQNGGTCTSPDNCTCAAEYTGPTCITPICSSSCQNGGSCTSPNTCACATGWTDSMCETPICTSPCLNGGTCTGPDSCSCVLSAWQGTTCNIPVCPTGCANGGTCTEPGVCKCAIGWTGNTTGCTTQIVCSVSCLNGGVCPEPTTCICTTGWSSNTTGCDTPVCSPDCQNGGTCSAPNSCSCPNSTWVGSTCTIAVCSPTCENGGSCTSPNSCACATGYTGPICETPTCNPPCLNGGSCTAANHCTCPTGWQDAQCGTPICNPACSSGMTCIGPNTCSEMIMMTGEYGVFHSTNFPSNYENNENITWLITVAPDSFIQIELDFKAVEINHDYLEIFDGPSTSAFRIVKRLTNSVLRATYVTSTNVALVHFYSDSVNTCQGFQLAYRQVNTNPDYSFEGNSTLPNWEVYPGVTTVMFQPNDTLRLVKQLGNITGSMWALKPFSQQDFVMKVVMQIGMGGTNCSGVGVFLVDNTSIVRPPNQQTNYEYGIKWNNYRGLSAIVSPYQKSVFASYYGGFIGSSILTRPQCTSSSTSMTTATCGTYTSLRGSVYNLTVAFSGSSGDFRMTHCSPLFFATLGYYCYLPMAYLANAISSSFIEPVIFGIAAYNSPSNYDSVDILQANIYTPSPNAIPVCTPPCMNGGNCTIWQTCKCPTGYNGTACQNAICNQTCTNGGTCAGPNKCSCSAGYSGYFCEALIMTGPDGHCQSSNFPNNYNLNEDTTWLIVVDPGYYIQLDFERLAFAWNDYMEIFDGDNNMTSTRLIKSIGDSGSTAVTYLTSNNVAYLHFRSTSHYARPGFQVLYRQVQKDPAYSYESNATLSNWEITPGLSSAMYQTNNTLRLASSTPANQVGTMWALKPFNHSDFVVKAVVRFGNTGSGSNYGDGLGIFMIDNSSIIRPTTLSSEYSINWALYKGLSIYATPDVGSIFASYKGDGSGATSDLRYCWSNARVPNGNCNNLWPAVLRGATFNVTFALSGRALRITACSISWTNICVYPLHYNPNAIWPMLQNYTSPVTFGLVARHLLGYDIDIIESNVYSPSYTPQCSQECENGGTCYANELCVCIYPSWTGRACEIPICNPPCVNGGTCVGPNNCSCPDGYQGLTCEILMVAASIGFCRSVNFPWGYSSTQYLSWLITVDSGTFIQLELDFRRLPYNLPDTYIKIYDAVTTPRLQLLKLWGSDLRATYLTSGNSVLIIFAVQYSLAQQGQGFELLYRQVVKNPAFSYEGNATLPNWTVYPGDTAVMYQENNTFRLVNNAQNQAGSMWAIQPFTFTDFVMKAVVRIGNSGSGSEGLAVFIVTNSSIVTPPTTAANYEFGINWSNYQGLAVFASPRQSSAFASYWGNLSSANEDFFRFQCSSPSTIATNPCGSLAIPRNATFNLTIAVSGPSSLRVTLCSTAFGDPVCRHPDSFVPDVINATLTSLDSPVFVGIAAYNSAGYYDSVDIIEFNVYTPSPSPNCTSGCSGSCPNNETLCACTNLYTGPSCDQPLCTSPCQHGGTCISPNTCQCPEGWQGMACATAICRPDCKGGGTCTAPDVCTCSNGWTGALCDIPVCSPICQNDGNCTAPFTCTCDAIYTGLRCETPICTPPCQHGGTCSNYHNCTCPTTSWVGDVCNIPVCSAGCQNGGTCVAPATCNCTSLYSGTMCTVPVCTPACQHGGTCTADHNCTCPISSWVGGTCQIPVCATACQHGGTCSAPNTCTCTSSWTGSICQNPVCSPTCQHGGTCVSPNNCSCTIGYNGTTCNKAICINGCANGGTCTSPNVCTCTSSYSGPNCTTPVCSPSGCQNGGTCIAPNNCTCSTGWTGTRCQTAICASACQNGGSCTAPDTCTCTTSWTDATCTIPVCSPSCLNGATCSSPNNCTCTSEYNGTTCNIPVCNPSCLNGATCSTPNNCTCTTQYLGPTCSIPICNSPCQNGATCIAPDTCQCTSSYNGSTCTIPVCSPPCKNGGTCSDPGTCTCNLASWNGTRCEIPVCTPSCENGGNCTAPNTCNCTSRWQGARCTIPVCSPNCSHGGTCIAPNNCTCTLSYTGNSCSIPICVPSCENGGTCIAPNNCSCTANYNGIDCTTPVCNPPCQHGATCVAPNNCSCVTGWQDSTCETAICNPACQHGGNCTAPDTCNCTTSWTDATCETPVCSPNCLNGATCSSPNNCTCTSEYNGTNCNIPVCDPSCQHGATCSSPNNCTCTSQYSGPTCTIPVCTSSCQNGATCIAPDTCQCTSSYNGSDCSIPVCSPPCKNGGTCSDPDTCACNLASWNAICTPSCGNGGNCTAPHTCNCTSSWQGARCTIPVCSPNCSHGGTCIAPNNCSCTLSYTGVTCTIPICSPNCENGGTCIAPNNCSCTSLYTGPICTIPVCDPPCQNGGTCGSPNNCTCAIGWNGTDCTSAICNATCQNGATCTAPDSCTCPSHWTDAVCSTPVCSPSCLNGGTCSAPNVCDCFPEYNGTACTIAVCNPSCQHGGSCTAPDTCSCTAQYSGPTCNIPICTSPCQNGATCTAPNTCACSTGWQGPVCDIPICNATCLNGATCSAPQTCTCIAGLWEGPTCSIPICDNTCSNGASCTLPGICICATGWTGNTTGCHEPVCTSPCHNGGSCSFPDTCTCTSSWNGTVCTIPVCSPSCENGGTCMTPDVCSCAAGWTGNHTSCTTAICTSPCLNGGTCSSPDTCTCASGWNGTTCESYTCVPSCQNGGTCNGANNCTCTNSWQGASCEIPVCSPDCLNGATCSSPNNCTCTTRWSGPICETPVCAPPCVNGGSCIGPDNCSCFDNWRGPICNMSCLDDSHCSNNGTCLDGVCLCVPGWTDRNCLTPFCNVSCENGATCSDPFTCTCTLGWGGPACSKATATGPPPLLSACERECADCMSMVNSYGEALNTKKSLCVSVPVEDFSDECAAWAARGNCLANAAFMWSTCRASCTRYSSCECEVPDGKPYDLNCTCGDYAALGLCETDPDIRTNCSFSCGRRLDPHNICTPMPVNVNLSSNSHWKMTPGPLNCFNGNAGYLQTAIMVCNAGFQAEKAANTGLHVCEPYTVNGEKGNWVEVNRNKPNCVTAPCPNPPEIAGGFYLNRTNATNSTTAYRAGDSLTFACGEGLAMTGAVVPVVTCTFSGPSGWTWHDGTPDCNLPPCNALVEGINTIVEVSANHTGGIANFQCKPGYRPSVSMANFVKTCQPNGTWTPSQGIPECTVVACGAPPEEDYAYLTGTKPCCYEFSDQVIVRCQKGAQSLYVEPGAESTPLSQVINTCLDTGFWSTNSLSCLAVTCSAPDAYEINQYRILNGTDELQHLVYDDVLLFECDFNQGYEPSVNETATKAHWRCNENSTWDKEPLSCAKNALIKTPIVKPAVFESSSAVATASTVLGILGFLLGIIVCLDYMTLDRDFRRLKHNWRQFAKWVRDVGRVKQLKDIRARVRNRVAKENYLQQLKDAKDLARMQAAGLGSSNLTTHPSAVAAPRPLHIEGPIDLQSI